MARNFRSDPIPDPRSGPLSADPEATIIRSGDGRRITSPMASRFMYDPDSDERAWDANVVNMAPDEDDPIFD